MKSNPRDLTLPEWSAKITLGEAMGMGTVEILKDLALEMEQYLSFGPAEDLPGTRFWLQQVRDTIKLNDSIETPPGDDTYISNLLAEYHALRPEASSEAEAGRSWLAGSRQRTARVR